MPAENLKESDMVITSWLIADDKVIYERGIIYPIGCIKKTSRF